MDDVHKGLSTRMEECSSFGVYLYCYGHVLNLAFQDTMTQIEPLRNALEIIQALLQLLRGESQTTRPV